MSYSYYPQPEMKTLWEAASHEPTFSNLINSRLRDFPFDTLLDIGMSDNIREVSLAVRVITKVINAEHPERMRKDELLELEEKMFKWAANLTKAFGSLENVRCKSILDIACGSRNDSHKEYYVGNYNYEPWFCRMVNELGGMAVGIDIRQQENESFEWYATDLRDPNALSCISTCSIDACHYDNFWLDGLSNVDSSQIHLTLAISQNLRRILRPEAKILGRHSEDLRRVLEINKAG